MADTSTPTNEADTTDPDDRTMWDMLMTTWRELNVPKGWRAEIPGEYITMTPPPGKEHGLIAARIHRALAGATPKGCASFEAPAVHLIPSNRLYTPDLVIMPEDDPSISVDDDTLPISAEHAALVVEIAARPGTDHDREDRRRAYAGARVPLYLVVDRWGAYGPEVALHFEPNGRFHQRIHRVSFGRSIALPEPFGIDLDTSDFPG
ncbi:Uma2 family endonuclease [Embleya sp. NPDC059237]|uniref:Uma2 family endonuclease n=1 Tax=Embleya sp. NPDC059237 TaxID=3346784 RepID=UPI0036CFF75F